MTTIPFLFSVPSGSEWLIVALGLVMLVFWIMMIVEIARSDFRDSTSKIVWLLVTLLLGVLGAAIYYFAGRNGRIEKAV